VASWNWVVCFVYCSVVAVSSGTIPDPRIWRRRREFLWRSFPVTRAVVGTNIIRTRGASVPGVCRTGFCNHRAPLLHAPTTVLLPGRIASRKFPRLLWQTPFLIFFLMPGPRGTARKTRTRPDYALVRQRNPGDIRPPRRIPCKPCDSEISLLFASRTHL
jgi:hypothetical protein